MNGVAGQCLLGWRAKYSEAHDLIDVLADGTGITQRGACSGQIESCSEGGIHDAHSNTGGQYSGRIGMTFGVSLSC